FSPVNLYPEASMRLARLAGLVVGVVGALCAAPFSLEHVGKIVRLTDPQIAPDGRSIAVVVSRANFEENRYDPQLVLVDLAARTQRVLTRERRDLSHVRWSPDGAWLAFLAK